MSPWDLVSEIVGDVYTEEQIDSMTIKEIMEIVNKEE
tara:strand:+ start:13 stop:123 length:111 start_codon:yes stop_codon:yes gene_type:complete